MSYTFTGLGGTSEVGASSYLYDLNGFRVLIDAGLRPTLQGKESLPLLEVLDQQKPHVMILTHAHLDHVGALPLVYRKFPKLPLYMTPATRRIALEVLSDAVRVAEQNRAVLYELGEATAVLANAHLIQPFSPVRFEGGSGQFTLFPAGHILGACGVLLESDKKVFHTGDFSNIASLTADKAFFPPHQLPLDLVVSEATYGDTNLPSRKSQVQQLIAAVKQVLEQGGRVLIPTFALGRAQELILILLNHMSGKLMPTVPIYLDGLVRSLTSAFEELLPQLPEALQKQASASKLSPFKRWPVQLVEDNDQRSKIINSSEPMIILASSGMLQGGPSPLYARALLQEAHSGLFIVGYQDEESPGRRLLELQQGGELMLPTQTQRTPKHSLKSQTSNTKLTYEAVAVACTVARYYLSAHADRNGILNLLSWYPSKRAIFMHGEGGARMSLLEALRDEREVYIPQNGEPIEFSTQARYGKYNRPALETATPTQVVETKTFEPTSAPPPPSKLKTFRSVAHLQVKQGKVTLEFPPEIDPQHLFPDGLYRVSIKMGSVTRAELTEVYKPGETGGEEAEQDGNEPM